jgi:hypothetical protein
VSFEVEVYRCGETLALEETLTLAEVLRLALAPIVKRDLGAARFGLLLHPVPAPPASRERPRVENLLPDYGYGTVIVVEDGAVTYRHPHPLEELFGRPLRKRLGASHPADLVWGYRIVGPGLTGLLTRPAPEVEGSFLVEPYLEGEAPGFRVRAVPDPDPPEASLAAFGIEAESDRPVKVLVRSAVACQLRERQAFSQEYEEGGFLVGRVFKDRRHAGTFLVEVTGALAARYTGASLLHFTFTGDSFQEVKRALYGRPDEQLLGWYHTHLFPAREEMGLSTVDLDLHFTTFRKPWQLAGLINFERRGERTLRFYVRRDGAMALCPQWEVEGGEVEGGEVAAGAGEGER